MNQNVHASVTKLARETELPRSTTYRLLDTLVSLGFAVSNEGGGYVLTRQVRSLSDGFLDEGWIEFAWQEMVSLSRELIWPISLFTCEPPTMVIRRTTHELSTMSIDYGMSGRRLPISETSAGRTYLAHCPQAERKLILAIPGAFQEPPAAIDLDMLDKRLRLIRERGFDTRLGGIIAKTGSISVPVCVDDRVLCCLSLIFIAAGSSIEQAIADFEEPLKKAAARIAHAARR